MALAMMSWIIAIPLLGAVTGLRSMTAMAVLCWFAYRGHLQLDGGWDQWATKLPTAIIFTVLAVSAGACFFVAGTVGLLRFPDSLTRLHALTKVDNLGLGLIVLGLLPRAGGVLAALKLLSVWLLVQLSGAIVSQLIARSVRRGEPDA